MLAFGLAREGRLYLLHIILVYQIVPTNKICMVIMQVVKIGASVVTIAQIRPDAEQFYQLHCR